MKTINARALRNDYAQVLRDVEAGESYTVTNHGRPVAQIGPLRHEESGPRVAVPFGEVAGALAHLSFPNPVDLHRQLDAEFDTDMEDPFERAAAERARTLRSRTGDSSAL